MGERKVKQHQLAYNKLRGSNYHQPFILYQKEILPGVYAFLVSEEKKFGLKVACM